jgi:hypothetical protein
LCTLIGTSTTILVSSTAQRLGQPPISMFEVTPLGIAMLIGAILPVDLRLLGVWRHELAPSSLARLSSLALTGLLLAMGTGGALFMVRASEYIENPYLLAKWAFLVLAILNALAFSRRWRGSASVLDSTHARWAGGLSIMLWLGALASGRWIAFA